MADETPFGAMETAYESLAEAIDAVGPQNEALFLTKLVLLLAQKSGDVEGFGAALAVAQQDLPPATG